NEDPVKAVLREIREEFGIEAAIVPLACRPRVAYDGGPGQIEPPYTLLNCRVAPDHEHVDCVYFCRVVSGYPGVPEDPRSPVIWVAPAQPAAGALDHDGPAVPFPPDVQALALEAIRLVSGRVEAGVR